MEGRVEALRTVKETAEQPEREAKERHLKAWEGKLKCDIISPSSVFHFTLMKSLVLFLLSC